MVINVEQRVGVLVDVQNLYYSARALYNARVNFDAILREVTKGRKLIRAIAYAIKAGDKDEDTFHTALERIGFEVKLKPLQIFYGGNKKADWDVGIAMDAIELAPKLDVVILLSGDGDYIPLVQHLQRALGCRVEAAAFGRSTSSKLRETVDEFIDLDYPRFVIAREGELIKEKEVREHKRISHEGTERKHMPREHHKVPMRTDRRGHPVIRGVREQKGLDALSQTPVFVGLTGLSAEEVVGPQEFKEEMSKKKTTKKHATKKTKKKISSRKT